MLGDILVLSKKYSQPEYCHTFGGLPIHGLYGSDQQAWVSVSDERELFQVPEKGDEGHTTSLPLPDIQQTVMKDTFSVFCSASGEVYVSGEGFSFSYDAKLFSVSCFFVFGCYASNLPV